MAITGWPSNVQWSQFKKLKARPKGATTDAHIQGTYANPPKKKFQPVKGDDGWRLENVDFVMSLIPSQTWVVTGKQSKKLLNHEQGHWDILGLLVRELEAEIEALRTGNPKGLVGGLNNAKARIDAKGEKLGGMKGRYDTETDHGRNAAAQTKWDQLIRTCITTGKNLPDK